MKRIFFFAAAMALSLGAAQAQQLDKLPVDSNVIVGHLDLSLIHI